MLRRARAFAPLALHLALPLALTATHALAQSQTMFDMDMSVSLQGTVKTMQWTNAHGFLFVTTMDAAGAPQLWALELGAPPALIRAGWRENSVKAGTSVTATIHPLKDGSHGGLLVSLVLPNGKILNGVPGE